MKKLSKNLLVLALVFSGVFELALSVFIELNFKGITSSFGITYQSFYQTDIGARTVVSLLGFGLMFIAMNFFLGAFFVAKEYPSGITFANFQVILLVVIGIIAFLKVGNFQALMVDLVRAVIIFLPALRWKAVSSKK